MVAEGVAAERGVERRPAAPGEPRNGQSACPRGRGGRGGRTRGRRCRRDAARGNTPAGRRELLGPVVLERRRRSGRGRRSGGGSGMAPGLTFSQRLRPRSRSLRRAWSSPAQRLDRRVAPAGTSTGQLRGERPVYGAGEVAVQHTAFAVGQRAAFSGQQVVDQRRERRPAAFVDPDVQALDLQAAAGRARPPRSRATRAGACPRACPGCPSSRASAAGRSGRRPARGRQQQHRALGDGADQSASGGSYITRPRLWAIS